MSQVSSTTVALAALAVLACSPVYAPAQKPAASTAPAAEATHEDGQGAGGGSTAMPWGTYLGACDGVAVYSNGPTHDVVGDYGDYGYMWQCVEYVNRYLTTAKGFKNLRGSGNANSYLTADLGLQRYTNDGTSCPAAGDVVVSPHGPYGHVGVVCSCSSNECRIAQQNWANNASDASFPISLIRTGTGCKLGSFGGGAYEIDGWLRVPGLTPTTTSTSTTIASTAPSTGDGSITVTSPVTGEVWYQGLVYTAAWISTNLLAPFRLVVLNGTGEMVPTLSTTAPNSGTLSIQVPMSWPLAGQYRVCATAKSGSIAGCSGTFTIASPITVVGGGTGGSVTGNGGTATSTGGSVGTGDSTSGGSTCTGGIVVTSPVAAEVWQQSGRYVAAWSSTCLLPPFRLVVTKGGKEVTPVISTTASTSGTQVIEVPTTWLPDNDYALCATASNGSVWGCSGNFVVAMSAGGGNGGVAGTGMCGVTSTGGTTGMGRVTSTGGTTSMGGATSMGGTMTGAGGILAGTGGTATGTGGTMTGTGGTITSIGGTTSGMGGSTWACDGKPNLVDGASITRQYNSTPSGSYMNSLYNLGNSVGPSEPNGNYPDQLATGYLSNLPAGRPTACFDYEIIAATGPVTTEAKVVSAPPSPWNTLVSGVDSVGVGRKAVCVSGVATQGWAGWQAALQIWSAGVSYKLHRIAVCVQ